jgi:DNA-binding response OmpR family regulator
LLVRDLAFDTKSNMTLPPVLIVDDDASCRQLLDAVLVALQLQNPRWHAVDADDAVAIMHGARRKRLPLPVLVLLDNQMPGRSGLDVLTWMRSQAEFAVTPVVMLTGQDNLVDVQREYALSVSSYLIKPVGFDALTDVLKSLDRPWALT